MNEYKTLKPIGDHFIAPPKYNRPIPDGCYDTIEGFYNPKTKCLYDPKDLSKILRIPTSTEEKWIIENCRKSSTEYVGPQKELLDEDDSIDLLKLNSSQENNN